MSDSLPAFPYSDLMQKPVIFEVIRFKSIDGSSETFAENGIFRRDVMMTIVHNRGKMELFRDKLTISLSVGLTAISIAIIFNDVHHYIINSLRSCGR